MYKKMAYVKSVVITPEDILKAYDKYGDDMVSIGWDSKDRENDKVQYYDTYITLADGRKVKPLVKYSRIQITGCKSPEERIANHKGAGPTFGLFKQTVGGDGSQVGEAMYAFHKSWTKVVESYNESLPSSARKRILSSWQEYVINPLGSGSDKFQKMDNPLLRIKYRSVNKDNNIIKGTIQYCVDEQNVRFSDKIDGMPITTDNIHLIATKNSSASGIINIDTTISSSQGISSTMHCQEQYIVSGKPSGGPSGIFKVHDLISLVQTSATITDDVDDIDGVDDVDDIGDIEDVDDRKQALLRSMVKK
jgi:hypothetical protein